LSFHSLKQNHTKPQTQHDSLQSIGLGYALIKDKEIKEMMESKISFNGERYQTKLCWNEELASILPTNYDMAYSQLISNLNRLRQTPERLKTYHTTIVEQEQHGRIERVPPLEDKYSPGRKVHYLPHHAVVRDEKEFTKVRVVYNASARRGKSPSLNQCLEKGPKLYNDLAGIQMRARLKPILIACDIEKAFHQILLDPEDRNCVRFLWAENPFEEKATIIEYRFTVVTFGVICSPAHLALTIDIHLRKFPGEFAKEIAKNAYVDNILAGVDKPEKVQCAYNELKHIFKQAGMNIREFVSNCVDQINKLPPEDRIDKENVKLLGIKWNVVRDEFKFSLPKWQVGRKITPYHPQECSE
jgi:hypothetical protein